MVQLFLPTPTWSGDEVDEFVQHRISLLGKLESVIWSLILSAGRAEARLWLCNTISSISNITVRHKRDLFLTLLKSKPVKRRLAAQVLQIILTKHPHKAGCVLAKKSQVLEKFFSGHPKRILQWFSSFGGTGDLQHGKGAKALSQFAFINRDICWEELEWKGKHGQSPATVATKPHYFLDLDVQRTVENFLEYVPEFWSSNEFSESLKDGGIFSLDINFFIDLFVDLLYKVELKEMWEVIEEFLMEESFSSLCQHLLIILDESELHVVMNLLRKYLNASWNPMEVGNWSYWPEVILALCGFDSLDQLLMLNAVVNHGRQLLRLVREEEVHEEKVMVGELVLQICASFSDANNLAPIIEECLKTKTINMIKMLGVQSWALHYRMSEKCQTTESWEHLFSSNKIEFRKSDDHLLLCHDDSSEQSCSDLDEGASRRSKCKKRGKRRKKRRKRYELYQDNELLDSNLQSKTGSWMLSLDGFSASWSNVDLPEYLSKYCFSTWMKWLFDNWIDPA